jgi:hypothetical protein
LAAESSTATIGEPDPRAGFFDGVRRVTCFDDREAWVRVLLRNVSPIYNAGESFGVDHRSTVTAIIDDACCHDDHASATSVAGLTIALDVQGVRADNPPEVAMDFIERIFSFAPDGGSGSLEFLLVAIPICGIIVLAARSRSRTHRRFQT